MCSQIKLILLERYSHEKKIIYHNHGFILEKKNIHSSERKTFFFCTYQRKSPGAGNADYVRMSRTCRRVIGFRFLAVYSSPLAYFYKLNLKSPVRDEKEWKCFSRPREFCLADLIKNANRSSMKCRRQFDDPENFQEFVDLFFSFLMIFPIVS